MSDQLAYVVITPYTIRKSRTGAVLSRLLGRTSAELIATQMFALDEPMAQAYAETIGPGRDTQDETVRGMIRDYILTNFAPDRDGRRHRMMLLVFRGEQAFDDIRNVVGRLQISSTTGATIRDTFGDLVYDQNGDVRYFEPCVLMGDSPDRVRRNLRMWLDFARTESPLLERVCEYPEPERIQQTLVLIKPDSWREKSSRPGAVIDMFSRTGLRIIGTKFCRISVAQALEFYGPVREVLRNKLAPGIGSRARSVLEDALDLKLAEELDRQLATLIGVPYAEEQFSRIVQFMTGRRPEACSPAELDLPGTVRSLALVYEGEDAVAQIRGVLGPTDPTKAPGGTVRGEFGSCVMVNTAHASDSPENAVREMGILKMREGNLLRIVEPLLNKKEDS